MSDEFIKMLCKFDPANLLAIAGMFWLFKKHLDGKFDKIDKRFEKIESDIKDLRTSLNRMEGAFYSKDCCMLKEDKSENKAVK